MKSFSELTSASQVNNGDLLAISQTSGSGYASKKTTVKDITDKSNLNLAEEYDSTSTYAVDDYVIYESVLYKCIASTTGTFDSTKWTSVVVTDEMGSGGGGGTGGHTIIDENGNLMTARAGLQFVGGANVSDDATNNKTIVDLASAGGIDGVFIDTSNVIQASTPITSSTDVSYMATEDCAVLFTVASDSNNSANIKINDVKILEQYDANGINQFSNYLFVKKGQTIKFHHTFTGGTGSYTVYGIQTGTTHSKFQPVIYSLEEREIGVWTDGKPLYEKTIHTGAVSTGENTIAHNILNAEHIIQGYGKFFYSTYEGVFPTVSIGNDNGWNMSFGGWDSTNIFIEVGSSYTGAYAITDSYTTIRYTKSTDTAGSGSWTPQGVPTHHYSTDEHIVGTWIDGSTLYEKTITITENSEFSDKSYTTEILALNADFIKLVSAEVRLGSLGNNDWYSSPFYYDLQNNMNVTVNKLQMNVYSRGWNFTAVNATVQYTKTS